MIIVFAFLLTAGVADARTRSYAITDFRTGAVLDEVNGSVRLHPASLTKMMTLYLVFEAVEDGRLGLDQRIRISSTAASMPPSRLGLRAGERVRLRHLIAAAAVKSANDAAVALAEAVGGTEWQFAEMMTRKARSLGMTATTFRNATGFTADGHLSTARDMALLGRRLLRDFPQHSATYARQSIRWGGRSKRATNIRFLNHYKGADGIKTGYTRAAGYTMVATAKRDGRRLLVSYFGASSSGHRARRVSELMNAGFERLREGPALVASVAAEPPRARPAVLSSPASPQPAAVKTASVPVAASPTSPEHPRPSMLPLSAGSGPWALQVGAYARKSGAEDRLRSVLARHSDLLRGAVPATPRNRRYYLAHLTGYGDDGAKTACWQLRQRGVDCLAVRTASRPPTAATATAAILPPQASDAIWSVQVGAYAQRAQAETRLLELQRQHGDVLADAQPATLRPGRYHLSQFTGFDERGAQQACATLRARGADCFAVEQAGPTANVALASAETGLRAASGHWSVQVGAYAQRKHAEDRLNALQTRHPTLLMRATARTQRPGRYFLAQFAGFDRHEAHRTCGRLRANGADCIPVETKPPAAAVPNSPPAPPIIEASAPGTDTGTPAPAGPPDSGHAASDWAIQVGAYARAAQAESQLRNVSAAFRALTEPSTPAVVRQRRYFAAQFHGFAEQPARAACDTLERHGVDCLAVLPEAPVAATHEVTGKTAPTSNSWGVQVGAYSRAQKARAWIDHLRAKGWPELGGHDFRVVRSGRFYLAQFLHFTEADAEAACRALQARGLDCLPVLPKPLVTVAEGKGDATAAAAASNTVPVLSEPLVPAAEGKGSAAATPTAPGTAPGWSVQVGAYARATQARAQLNRIKSRLGPDLQDARAWVPKQGGLFLARFRDLDRKNAEAICSALKSGGSDCLALAPSGG